MTTYNETHESAQNLAAKLKSVLDGQYESFRDDAREFVNDLGMVPQHISLEDHRKLAIERTKKFAEAGYSQMPYPSEYGGKDEGREFLNFVEILSHGDLSTVIKQGVNYGLFGMSITSLGTEKHHEKYLNDVMNARLLGGFAMTEMSGGSNVQGLKTTALYDKETDSFIINTPFANARKAYIGNAAEHGQMAVVFAQLHMEEGAESEGVHAFMVPLRDLETNEVLDGVKIEDHGHKVGLNGVDNGMITFTDVRVPRDAMLDKFATVNEQGVYESDEPNKNIRFFKMIGTLVTGRIVLSVSSLSAAKNALKHVTTAAQNREVFGDTLLDLPATHEAIFPDLAEAYAMHFATRELVEDSLNLGDRDLENTAAALKAQATDWAFNVVDKARRKEGGEGYMAKYDFGMMRNDLDIYRTFEGDNTVLRLFVARNLLGNLARKFKGASAFEQMKTGLSLKFNVAAGKYGMDKFRHSKDALMDSEFHIRLMERKLLAQQMDLGNKIRTAAKKQFGGDSKAAFDHYAAEAEALTRTYTACEMLKSFASNVAAQTDPDVKAALQDLCDLYAVDQIRNDASWYLENGLLSASQTRALADFRGELFKRIRPNAEALVDAFAVPEDLLAPAPESNMAPRQITGSSLKLI